LTDCLNQIGFDCINCYTHTHTHTHTLAAVMLSW